MAVMQPDKAHRETGLPNHLLRKNMGLQLQQVPYDLSEFKFPRFIAEVIDYPYSPEKAALKDQALMRLTAIFHTISYNVTPGKHLQLRNIFYGYEAHQADYEFVPKPKQASRNQLFEITDFGTRHYKIHLNPVLKNQPVIDRVARLVALMTAEMQVNLATWFGGMEIYPEFHYKFFWVSEIFAAFTLWDLVHRLPEDTYRDALLGLAHKGPSPALSQLSYLKSMAQNDDIRNWLYSSLFPTKREEEKYLDEIMGAAVELLGQHFLNQPQVAWQASDHDMIATNLFDVVQMWWRWVPREKRFRVLHEAHEGKDSILESVIASESIIVKSCTDSLTSHH